MKDLDEAVDRLAHRLRNVCDDYFDAKYGKPPPVEPPEDWESRRGYPRAFHQQPVLTVLASGRYQCARCGHVYGLTENAPLPPRQDCARDECDGHAFLMLPSDRREEVRTLQEALRREKKSNRSMQRSIGQLTARADNLARRPRSKDAVIRIGDTIRVEFEGHGHPARKFVVRSTRWNRDGVKPEPPGYSLRLEPEPPDA